MKEIVDGLNEEQREAVCAPFSGSVLVLAGAGCGKTTVLTRRVAWLCKNGYDPESICALTFTRKAAEEMRERVCRIESMAANGRKPCIATFHSLSLSILQDKIDEVENFVRLGYFASFIRQPEVDRLKLISEIVAKEDREILGADLTDLDSLITKCSVFPEKIDTFSVECQTIINKILKLFTSEKRRRGVWDFEDLTADVIELFRRDSLVLEYYQKKFRYFLVDEFQDTNPMQINFLRKLLIQSTGLFAVGDDDQAIYGFRGADVRPTLEFTKLFRDAKIVKLQTNYRCSRNILQVANSIFKKKPAAYRKVLTSGFESISIRGIHPKWLYFENQVQMSDFIIAETKRLLGSLKISMKECAILFRINKSLEWVTRYYSEQGYSIEETPTMVTIHGCKGLEYRVVFLCDLEEGVFPNYRPPGKKKRKGKIVGRILDFFLGGKEPAVCDWDEEQRLFYVGVTRAKQVLYMISAKNKYVYGRLRKFEKSRFKKLI